jgi:hypothetical protein
MLLEGSIDQLVVTFDELLRRTPFAQRMRAILKLLETHYFTPVDTEFTARIQNPEAVHPEVEICLLQCRPQSHYQEVHVEAPQNIPESDVIFATRRMVPHGQISRIEYVLFVSPKGYFALPTAAARAELGRAIARLNLALANRVFICVGPGRWGTTNPDLGVRIGYSDIYNTSALVELSGKEVGSAAPEPSFGTHFFQDLVEARIYPLGIYLDDEDVQFNREFFYQMPNSLGAFLPDEMELQDCLRLIEVAGFRKNHHLDLVMDADSSRAVAYLVPD